MPRPGSGSRQRRPAFEYDVAISFAGPDRDKARVLAALLDAAAVRVFFDEFEKARLWGHHGTEEFYGIYAERARYAVVLVSSAYSQREWTRHELRSVRDRALREKGTYLLPVRTEPGVWLDGIPRDVLYLDWAIEGVISIVSMISRKLGLPVLPPTCLTDTGRTALEHLELMEVGLSSRIVNSLERSGRRSLSDLLEMSANEVLLTKNLGRKSLDEINDALTRLGLRLGAASRR